MTASNTKPEFHIRRTIGAYKTTIAATIHLLSQLVQALIPQLRDYRGMRRNINP